MDRGKLDGTMVRLPHELFSVLILKGLYQKTAYCNELVHSSCPPILADGVLESSASETLQAQFSGYGSTTSLINSTLDSLSLKTPLESWTPETIHRVVVAFVSTKFPTVLALNKIDHEDASANIARIAKAYASEPLVLTSALNEVFLRKLAKQGYIRYLPGSDNIETRDDLIEMGEEDGGGLKELDEKLKARIEDLKDMLLYRFGGTGVVQVLSRAAEMLGLVPVFPVKNAHAFSISGNSSDNAAGSGPVFRDCVLVRRGTTVKEVARKLIGDAPLAFVEGPGGIKVSEDEVVGVGKFDVLSFKLGR